MIFQTLQQIYLFTLMKRFSKKLCFLWEESYNLSKFPFWFISLGPHFQNDEIVSSDWFFFFLMASTERLSSIEAASSIHTKK